MFISPSAPKPTSQEAVFLPKRTSYVFNVHTKHLYGIYCQCHSPVTPAVVLAFFPISPTPGLRRHAPPPHHHHHPALAALYVLQEVYLLFGAIRTLILFQSNSIFLYRTTLSVFAPNKSDLVCVTGAFLQSEINVWVLEQGCFLFGLDPIKSCLAP